MTAIDDLEAAATNVANANAALTGVLSGAVAEFPLLAQRIADLVAQLAAIPTEDPRIAAVVEQLTPVATQLTQEASDLKTAADAAASALPAVPTP